MYTNNDELVLLRKAVKQLSYEIAGIKYNAERAYNRRTHSGVMQDIQMISLYAKSALSIANSVNKDNLINHKNKEILIEQYRKQLDEVYPT